MTKAVGSSNVDRPSLAGATRATQPQSSAVRNRPSAGADFGSRELRRDKDRRPDEVLPALAHELRNSLAAMRGAMDLLSEPSSGTAVLEQARIVLEHQVRHMTHLVDHLLDASRIARGTVQLELARVNLIEILQHAVDATAHEREPMNQVLHVVGADDPVYLRADAVRLEQVFGNLLDNASKYSPPGSHIWINVDREEAVLPGNNVPVLAAVVRIRDTGVGIAPEMLDRIFDMYARVGESEHGGQSGLGIGLALVREFVGLHGGTVEAFSAGESLGSEFVVCLPTLPEPPQGRNAQVN